MNIKFVAGFLAGIMLVISIWYFSPDIRERLFHEEQLDKTVSLVASLEEKKEVAQETNFQNNDSIKKSDSMEEKAASSSQNTVETQIDIVDAVNVLDPVNTVDSVDVVAGGGNGDIDIKKSIQEQNHVSWVEIDRSSSDDDLDLVKNDVLPGNQTDTTLDEFKNINNVINVGAVNNTPVEKNVETVLSASDEGGKFFFWKPFSLGAKAKKFAAYITSGSNVNCLVDKTETGHYQVYYLYKDEADKLAKAELIKNTGITF